MEAEWQERIRKHFAELAEAIIGAQDHIVYLTKERDELRTELATVTAERDELKAQLVERSDAADHLAACVTGREVTLANLWTIVNDETDPYTAQKIYQRFRLWEEGIPRR